MGSMDEFYIFDRSLPQIEIKKLSETCNFKRVVMHFGFELFDGKVTYDQSGLANNGIAGGVVGASLYGKCGKALNMTKGEIKLSGKNVRGKPLEAISIAVWVSLQTNRWVNVWYLVYYLHGKTETIVGLPSDQQVGKRMVSGVLPSWENRDNCGSPLVPFRPTGG